jgi:hypothetical protein
MIAFVLALMKEERNIVLLFLGCAMVCVSFAVTVGIQSKNTGMLVRVVNGFRFLFTTKE